MTSIERNGIIANFLGICYNGHIRAHPCSARRANPLRGGDAKPMGLFHRGRRPGYRKGYQHAIGVFL
jgi:hypothetical protein